MLGQRWRCHMVMGHGHRSGVTGHSVFNVAHQPDSGEAGLLRRHSLLETERPMSDYFPGSWFKTSWMFEIVRCEQLRQGYGLIRAGEAWWCIPRLPVSDIITWHSDSLGWATPDSNNIFTETANVEAYLFIDRRGQRLSLQQSVL